MAATRLGGQAGHGRADEIRRTLRLLRVAGGDIVADHALRGEIEGTRRLARLPVVATRAFHHQAAARLRTDSGDRDAVIARVRDSGPLDVLVVNSGFALFGDALEQDPDEVDRLFRVNVHAPYHASVEAARQMPEGGRIIIIGSVNGDRMPVPGMASYALSKSALQGLARGLARDFGPRGITINVVQPGPIDTDANPADGPMKDLMHSFMAIKRHGRAEEVAGMVAWLAGPEASFVTGAMHTIDGGFGA